ncbi:glycosyltransferase 87 family protein [Nocardia sp. alder85J]|uniref:glycosyltransferase 87 family protein n=1 Tax=Nocardia sp. alder85J TaxID=2862949 RepID=UPI001CD69CB4|nr:glycosyltransferase 87 family protein [Nocardia sp. alder85J]MCX4096395.1 glycosyltransferase 87 family protein [Nocardia sp. alder85J]
MSSRPAAGDTARTAGRWTAAIAVLFCAVTLLFAYLNKARCAGPPFTPDGRSLMFDRVKDAKVCYSDIQFLWLGRDINAHIFPYVNGDITADGTLIGGAVEYPVLSGLLMWIGAAGVHNDADFLLHSALLLAPFALLTAWMLGRLSGPAAMLWAVGSPLVLYAFHNWELPVVCTAAGAVYVVATLTRYSLRTRGIIAAVLLGIGFCLKLYPGIFVLPLLVYLVTGGDEVRAGRVRRRDVWSAVLAAVSAVVTVALINLPFALAGYDGWRASITFQQLRQADITTNSVWYWGVRPMFGDLPGSEASFQQFVSTVSPALVMAAFVLAMWLGWRRFQTSGVFPWVGVSGAMLCGFLLFHKVHSPQYTLWLVPFMVLLEVPWTAIGLYLLADAAIGIGVFRYFYALGMTGSADLEGNIVQFGVWGRAILLVYFFFAFARARPRDPDPVPVVVRRATGELLPVGH